MKYLKKDQQKLENLIIILVNLQEVNRKMMLYRGISGKQLLAKKVKKYKKFTLYAIYDGKRFLYNTTIPRQSVKPCKAK